MYWILLPSGGTQASTKYQYIWKSKWGLIKCLYLWSRYGTFLNTTLDVTSMCNIDIWVPQPKFNSLQVWLSRLIFPVAISYPNLTQVSTPPTDVKIYKSVWCSTVFAGVGIGTTESMPKSVDVIYLVWTFTSSHIDGSDVRIIFEVQESAGIFRDNLAGNGFLSVPMDDWAIIASLLLGSQHGLWQNIRNRPMASNLPCLKLFFGGDLIAF